MWTKVITAPTPESYLHVTVCCPLFEALRALVRLLTGVNSDVISKSGGSCEGFSANVATVRPCSLCFCNVNVHSCSQFRVKRPNCCL